MVPAAAVWPFRPTPLVRFACGSRSTSRTRFPDSARDVARLIAVVVFATPPFWLATATTRALLVTWPISIVTGGSKKKNYSAVRMLARQRFVRRILKRYVVPRFFVK